VPEGHTIHRLAGQQQKLFGGHVVRASSPQGRFVDGAALIDGRVLRRTEAYGKHLLHHYTGGPLLHVHLGLYGKFASGQGAPPEPRGALRLRLTGNDAWTDLRGATACELITPVERKALIARLGPDPLRRDADAGRAFARMHRSKIVVGALLMDQQVVAGIGNVYRAEVLFRHGIDPYRAGRDLSRAEWDAIWADLVVLMREGVRNNRIDTVRPEHTPEAMGRPPRVDDHGGEVYVYRRDRQPCHICGGEVRTADLANRNLFWCPNCQRH
jgi:endonuclease VIII